MYLLGNITCGGIVVDAMLPNFVSLLVTLIKIGVPVILIIFGMLDLGKAVMANKEDEIKKGQQTFIKRAIAAILVFLVVAIVQLVFGLLVKAGSTDNPMQCVSCFINANSTNCPAAR